MSIITKTGDLGKTSIIGTSRISKADIRPEAIGNIDELSSHLGLIYAIANPSKRPEFCKQIILIQRDLYKISAELAMDGTVKLDIMFIGAGDVSKISALAKNIEQTIKPLEGLLLPGGGNVLSAHLDIARSVCRRAERKVVAFLEREKSIDGDISIIKYLNRLSDFLFLLARTVESERIYSKE